LVIAAIAAPHFAGAQGACTTDGLKLPAGFCATIFADSLPGVRSIAVAPNGDLFVAMQNARTGGVMALRDAAKAGKADRREKFASGFGSSQVALFDNHLYVEMIAAPPARPARGTANAAPPPPPAPPGTTTIVRYALKAGELTPAGAPDTIIQDIPAYPGHSTRNFAIAPDGSMYLNIGSPTNACQPLAQDRAPTTPPGENPCVQLDTRAGVWKFDARKMHQSPNASNHFAKGIRNAVGIAVHPGDNKLWTTQHGRDQLYDWHTKLGLDSAAAQKYNAENPAEELLQANQGDDFGWPYCYFAVEQKHLVLAPEYGGNGKEVGQCAQKKEPVATFPGHWAPNALMFYTGSQFPAKYRNGAFIAFHGSWNRAPEPQGGFNVVFQPLDAAGKSAGRYEVFADDFAPNVGTGRASAASGAHRPTGLATGADGSLYVADDAGGRIYRIYFKK
jgi:glucose/arabinose dehydrogenase